MIFSMFQTFLRHSLKKKKKKHKKEYKRRFTRCILFLDLMFVKMNFKLGLLLIFALTTFDASVDCRMLNFKNGK